MKKILFIILMLGLTLAASAQYKGKIEIYKYNDMTLHSYTSYEEMGDVNFLVEGKDGLVLIEAPSFFNSISEFKSYCESLGKPIVKVAALYHTAGLVQWEPSLIVMIEGMPEFDKGEIVKNMMSRFDEQFKGKMDTRPHSNTNVIPADSKQTWAGVDFQFIPAPSTSLFPAADVIIANKVYYMHSAPTISHSRGVKDENTIDALLTYFGSVKNSGCELVVGSHGVATRMDAIEFQLQYLTKMKETLNKTKNKSEFVKIMSDSFVGLPEINNLTAVADNLYK